MFGQSAFEYLMMFAIVLTLLSVLVYYAQETTEGNREEIRASNAMIAVSKITEAADTVYIQGEPAQITMSVYIPESVNSICCYNKMVVMKVSIASGISDVFSTSKANLTCSKISDTFISGSKVLNCSSISNVIFTSNITGTTQRIAVKAVENHTSREMHVDIGIAK
jgi:Flp pilus assembly protein TadG